MDRIRAAGRGSDLVSLPRTFPNARMADSPHDTRQDSEIDWLQARALMRERISLRLGPCDAAVLEDLTQEGIIQLLRLTRREAPRNLGGMVTVVARSVAIDEIRRRQRQRLRFADWESVLNQVGEASEAPLTDAGDSELLWFLMLEFFRRRRAPCLELAQSYSEHGNWRDVATAVGRGYEAVRQQWARCTKVFRDELERNPGPFREWTDSDG